MPRKYMKRIVANYVTEPKVGYLKVFRTPEEVSEHFKPLACRDREEFWAIHLDRSNHLICWDQVSVGTLSECQVSPREVLKTAMLSNASALIFLHNHPSENINPSPEDRVLTERLRKAADIFGIRVLDHIILTLSGAFFSFQEHGLLN